MQHQEKVMKMLLMKIAIIAAGDFEFTSIHAD